MLELKHPNFWASSKVVETADLDGLFIDEELKELSELDDDLEDIDEADFFCDDDDDDEGEL